MNRNRDQKNHPLGNDLPALEILAGQLRPGDLIHVEVAHDPWCNLLKRKGPCNCRPDIRARGVRP